MDQTIEKTIGGRQHFFSRPVGPGLRKLAQKRETRSAGFAAARIESLEHRILGRTS